jgi:hypothetical protein
VSLGTGFLDLIIFLLPLLQGCTGGEGRVVHGFLRKCCHFLNTSFSSGLIFWHRFTVWMVSEEVLSVNAKCLVVLPIVDAI